MIPEVRVREALVGLAEGRVFPDFAPAGTALPFITFQAVGGEPLNFVSGEMPDKTNTRMQVNVWAETRLEAAELGHQVEAALRAASDMQVDVITGRVATFDETTQYRGTMQDFNLFC